MANDALAAFISYSRQDSDFALRLAEDLKAAGANVWLDQIDLVGGQLWESLVQEALDSCPRMLVILSPASVGSPNVMAEVSFALEERKTVIPIFFKDCVIPFRLRPVQRIDFRQDYQRGLKDVVRALRTAPATAPAELAPTPKPEPQPPVTRGRREPPKVRELTAKVQQSQSKQKGQIIARAEQPGRPAKQSNANATKKAASPSDAQQRSADETKRITAERKRKERRAAQNAAADQVLEGIRRERAKELKQREVAKQRAAAREVRKTAEAERKRKERRAVQNAAAEQVLEGIRRERAKELKQREAAKQRAAAREVRTTAEAERKRKERRAAQNAAAERVLERIKRERAQASGRSKPVSPAHPRDKQAPPKLVEWIPIVPG